MIRMIIMGACGRMGSAILKLAAPDPDFEVAHLLEAKGHPSVGSALSVPGTPKVPLVVEDDLAAAIHDADVVIDFTEAHASFRNFEIAARHGKAAVIGTTGISPENLGKMIGWQGARAVISPNMSIGVNLLFSLTERAARVLGRDYDAEIVEMHHKWKKDAPSGTATKLRDMVTGVDPTRGWVEVTGRQGIIGERGADEIGVLSLRGGDIVGEHTVLFAGPGERVELTHRAYSRDNFARGALAAAKWLVAQKNGVYDMADVLGLKSGT